jgi:ATP-dependent Clp protease adaptor protein ClpS
MSRSARSPTDSGFLLTSIVEDHRVRDDNPVTVIIESECPAMPENPVEAPEQQPPPSGGTAVKEKPRTAPPRVDRLPPFRVLLHNDDVNDILFVIETLVELTPLNRLAAVKVTVEADRKGVAQVMVTHRERAELYQEQLSSRRLTVTVEAAE